MMRQELNPGKKPKNLGGKEKYGYENYQFLKS